MSSHLTSRRRLARTLCLAAIALLALPAGFATAAPSEDDPPPPPPQLTINPTSYDFGMVDVSQGGQQAGFNIQNVGVDWAPVTIEFTGPDAESFWLAWDGCSGGSLSPWATCGIGVHFGPSDGRDYTATLVVRSGDAEFTSELTGTGALRRVTATPSIVDFGSVAVGDSATRSVTLQNTGNVFFQSMVAIPVSGHVGAFRVVEDGCSMHPLAPTIGCNLKLRFTPSEADNAEATLAVIGDGNPLPITLRGVGTRSTAGPAADAATSAKPKPARKPARVAFNWRRGLPAPFQGSRIDLGVARCQGAPTCRVSVRAWFVTDGAGAAAGTRTTSVRRSTWWIGNGSPVSVWTPQGLHGAPLRLVVDLRTKAAGRPVGVQRFGVRLVEGVRRGGAVIAG